jgi:predicted phage tail protein
MSYSCSGAPRVLVFSNPDVTWNGHAAGISYEANPSNSAENARSMNNTAATVAAFRGSSGGGTPTPPAAPSNLDVSSAEYNRVTVAWRDNASNESGFKLERSDDGVAFAEIATLGADTSSYTDGSVNAGADYYYRVRAFNSTGTSGYSNNLNVRVPDAPPPPPQAPTSVGASNNADGSATVSWSVGSGSTATGFEVRREDYDSRRNRWRGATTVANVSANVLSIVDVSGSGLFRYSVRAVNGSGSSAYAGPSQVDVTGGSSSGSGGGKGKGKGRK